MFEDESEQPLKLTLLLAGALAAATPLAYSADSPAGAQTFEQQGGTSAKVAKPANTTTATASTAVAH